MTLRIALAQHRFPVGDIPGNTRKVLDLARTAMTQQADMVVFPELTLAGYPPEDLLLRPSLTRRIDTAIDELKAANLPIAMVVGYPERENGKLYNKAMVIESGRIVADYRKQHLPNYQVFDEKRYFQKGSDTCVFEYKGARIALTICEDIWYDGPARRASEAGADINININGSPYHIDRVAERHAQVARVSKAYNMTTVYVNHIGGQDELLFDGGSFIAQNDGQIPVTLPVFEESLQCFELAPKAGGWQVVTPSQAPELSVEAELYGALKLGLADYVNRNGFPGVVLGLSGGIDSGLSAAIAVDALGADRVMAVMMPYEYTAKISLEDAEEEAQLLGIRYEVLPIGDAYEAAHKTVSPLFGDRAVDTTEQNMQSRMRGLFLMALSNKLGHMVLTTGNKSEMAVGYATLYGDMCGGFNALKDVPKTWVYSLAKWRNEQGLVIPERVITRPPSAELAPDQKDEDSLPDYDTLDAIIERYVERDESLDTIVSAGFDRDTVYKVIRLIDINEYKRRQAPEGVRVTPRGFGRDRRYPITQGWKPGV
ncbi:NAD+ synthase [Saccharospirillum salsuginis]|uniref:Glutamine-dependent NAD(+) synthetase n=1 Tax=Saccharospirillum salsuginis TaxID=418750 RepID=A0A918N9Y8_9GAMM|nr:NAD+ synthase [Saccharospirillum salsuginis]GGX55115.1 NAD+ synthase [Saccharospirillum salsuginis]